MTMLMTGLPNTLSPRKFAQVLGVSESSVRRWIDDGRIHASRTAGGHRRIAVHDAVTYIRERRLRVVRPDMLGWGAEEQPDTTFEGAVRSGNLALARQIVLGSYSSGAGVASLCDELICPALQQLGEVWEDGSGISREHLATTICIDVLHRLRCLAEPVQDMAHEDPRPARPRAMGSGAPGEPYQLPSLMASTVLAADGWEVLDFGADLPLEVLAEAAREHEPRLVWVSVCSTPGGDVRNGIARLLELAGAGPPGSPRFRLVVGGRGADQMGLGSHPALARPQNMRALADLAQECRG